MKKITLLASAFVFTFGTIHAQITTQPASQSAPSNTKVNTGQYKYQETGQVQQVQPTYSVPSGGQVPKVSAAQDHSMRSNVPSTGQTIQNAESSTNPFGASGQAVNANPNGVITGQETYAIPQPANNGQVPKVYTNMQETLPYRQLQPKPTGQIDPARMPVNKSSSRIR